MPIEEVDIKRCLSREHGFDGSSIRSFKTIESSDMKTIADPTTTAMMSVCAMPTLSLICDVVDPSAARRSAAILAMWRKALAYLRSTGIAGVYMGPERRNSSFSIRCIITPGRMRGYAVDSEEVAVELGCPGLGHQIGFKGGYFPVMAPYDANQDLRSEMVRP